MKAILYIKKALYIFTILLLINGCDKNFEELNTNPNDPTEVPVNTLLPNILRSISVDNNTTSRELTNPMMQLSFRADGGAHLYAIETYTNWWNTTYGNLKNIDYILAHSDKDGYENYYGIALVLRVYIFSVLTNLYGDVPYSNAGKGKEGIYYAGYDKQQDIYADLIERLDTANSLLGKGGITIESDIIFNGDVLKWKKLANSLLVRLLIDQSNKVDPSAKLQEMIDNPDKYPIMGSNDDQPEYRYLSETGNYYPGSDRPYDLKATLMANTLVDSLKNHNDERIKAFADTIVSTGMDDKYYGAQPGEIYSGNTNDVSHISGLEWDSKEKPAIVTVLMSYAELRLLLAEAAEKGWISGGSSAAKEYYEEGIKASYNFYRDMVNNGIAKGISLIRMKEWDGSYLLEPNITYEGSQDEKLHKIATQQWIGFYNNLQGYFYWRRVNIPVFVPGSQAINDGKIPVRLLYPEDEKTLNNDNYQLVIKQQGPDDINTKMWLIN